MTSSSRAMTAPTSGFGLTRPATLLGQLDRAGEVAAIGVGLQRHAVTPGYDVAAVWRRRP